MTTTEQDLRKAYFLARGGKVWVAFLTVLGLLLLLAVILFVRHAQSAQRELRDKQLSICQNNLFQFGLVMKMYANESKGKLFPPLSSEPGKLMFEAKLIVPDYLSDAHSFYCSALMNGKAIRNPIVNADSYIYLGYILRSDADVEQFAKYHKEHAKKGGAFDEMILNGNTDPNVPITDKLPFLREGIERFYITDINDPLAPAKVQSMTPAMIEWPDNHGNPYGGFVLYMNGHVEFIKYPGKWPMTEKTMKILCELAGRPPIGERDK